MEAEGDCFVGSEALDQIGDLAKPIGKANAPGATVRHQTRALPRPKGSRRHPDDKVMRFVSAPPTFSRRVSLILNHFVGAAHARPPVGVRNDLIQLVARSATAAAIPSSAFAIQAPRSAVHLEQIAKPMAAMVLVQLMASRCRRRGPALPGRMHLGQLTTKIRGDPCGANVGYSLAGLSTVRKSRRPWHRRAWRRARALLHISCLTKYTSRPPPPASCTPADWGISLNERRSCADAPRGLQDFPSDCSVRKRRSIRVQPDLPNHIGHPLAGIGWLDDAIRLPTPSRPILAVEQHFRAVGVGPSTVNQPPAGRVFGFGPPRAMTYGGGAHHAAAPCRRSAAMFESRSAAEWRPTDSQRSA